MAEIKEQFLHLWNNFGKQQKILLGIGAVAIFVAILGWSYFFGGRADYVPLYTNLETKDAGDIVNHFRENNISYEIANNGSSILVPQKDVYQLRMDLASQGLPRGKKGFEIFEESKFGTTEFQNKVNYLQALQGELARTIEQIQEVESARVHIVLPEDSLYKKNEKPASASVMLQLRSNSSLRKEQIQGIVNLVSHSVQGLTPENITLIDGFARVLNVPEDQETERLAQEKENNADASKMSKFYFNLTREIQSEMQENVQTLLDKSLGEKRAVARVNVELNFDRRLIDKQIFQPTTEDRGILRSTQDINETYQGGNTAPGGVPGTTSNIPGYPGGVQNPQSNYEKKESTRNYEISEIKEKIIQQPVSIKRVTVAVFIDEALTQAQQDSISRVVASAAGFNEERGDLISVERVPFSAAADIESQIQSQQTQQQLMRYAIYIIPALLLVIAGLAYFFYTRNKKKKELLAAEQAQKDAAAANANASQSTQAASVAGASLASAATEENEEEEPVVLTMDRELSQEEKEIAAKLTAIEEWAETQPEEFVTTLRTWLSADE